MEGREGYHERAENAECVPAGVTQNKQSHQGKWLKDQEKQERSQAVEKSRPDLVRLRRARKKKTWFQWDTVP